VDGIAKACVYLPLQQSPQPLWQQVELQLPPQQVPHAAFMDLNCEACATAVTARTTASERNAIVRFMMLSFDVEIAVYKTGRKSIGALQLHRLQCTSGAV
jgi:hypothetical protein